MAFPNQSAYNQSLVHKSFKYTIEIFCNFLDAHFFLHTHIHAIYIPVDWLHLIVFDMALEKQRLTQTAEKCLKEANLRQINLYPILYWLLNLSHVFFRCHWPPLASQHSLINIPAYNWMADGKKQQVFSDLCKSSWIQHKWSLKKKNDYLPLWMLMFSVPIHTTRFSIRLSTFLLIRKHFGQTWWRRFYSTLIRQHESKNKTFYCDLSVVLTTLFWFVCYISYLSHTFFLSLLIEIFLLFLILWSEFFHSTETLSILFANLYAKMITLFLNTAAEEEHQKMAVVNLCIFTSLHIYVDGDIPLHNISFELRAQ